MEERWPEEGPASGALSTRPRYASRLDVLMGGGGEEDLRSDLLVGSVDDLTGAVVATCACPSLEVVAVAASKARPNAARLASCPAIGGDSSGRGGPGGLR